MDLTRAHQLRQTGLSYRQIADQFAVGLGTVHAALQLFEKAVGQAGLK